MNDSSTTATGPATNLHWYDAVANRDNHRWIDHLTNHPTDPTLILIGGLHGNEPTGIAAIQKVFSKLRTHSAQLAGNLFGLRGNLTALHVERRYLDRDLNRAWHPERVAALQKEDLTTIRQVEDRELVELLHCLETVRTETSPDLVLLDLHTSSAKSVPFIVESPNPENTRMNRALSAPVVIDRQGYFRGALLTYMGNYGYPSLAFEAGQHVTPESVDLHEAAIWMALSTLNLIAEEEMPVSLIEMRKRLNDACAGFPGTLELFHRHAIRPEDNFIMRPGFKNFQAVERGQVLAYDRWGEIRCPDDARIFLPLYQREGEDGFFLVREVEE